ncbi:MAG TPA: homoserine kinase [Candidatus Limnocylindrales bacterium]|nr:homoserine kinase [Candidatus Limnocylindrales bacterium]
MSDLGAYSAIVGRRMTVDVPASSANLGAGYDCLGLALDLTNTVTVEAIDGDGSIAMSVTGEGEGALEASRANRFVAGLEAALEVELGPRPASLGWRIEMANRIPLSRGLGSSAAATVGGVVLGDALACAAGAPAVRPLHLLQIATTIESHPDNAAAVLLGGFVVSAHLADRVEAVRFDAPDGLRCVLYIPDRHLATEEMRRVLPGEVPLRHAVENLGRVAIGVAGIAAGRVELLGDLTVDRLHEPYRSVPYPELPKLTMAAREAGALGAFLSGAGSTICAFVAPGADTTPIEAALRAEADECGLAGRVAVVAPRNRGPEIRPN